MVLLVGTDRLVLSELSWPSCLFRHSLSSALPPVSLGSEATGDHAEARPQDSPCDVGVRRDHDSGGGRLPRGKDLGG